MLRPILIAGPTASGKSALALDLAERRPSLIVNADSMQVYAELQILTARPGAGDLARTRHALYGHVPADEAYSAGRFVRELEGALVRAREQDLTPIVVGGTGLYFKALAEGLAPIPDIPPDIRQHWRDAALRLGANRLHEVLRARDAVMAARLAAGDTQRITRALEVLDTTGRSLADWQTMRAPPLVPDDRTADRILLMPPRDVLFARTDARFDRMIEAGAIAEAAAFAALGLDETKPAVRALGVQSLIAHLAGEIELDEAIATAKLETRQYVKRQQTWMKRHMMSWNCKFS